MARSRFLAVGLAVVLLVGACGGDQDGDPGSSADDTPARASATPEAGPEDSMGADSITSSEQTDPSAPDTASGAAPLDSTSSIETQDSVSEALSQPVVPLGDRFEWCAAVQAVWDAHDQAMAALVAAESRHEEALKDYEAAANESDRAEAREVIGAANADVGRANDDFRQAFAEAVQQLLHAKNYDGSATHHVAYRRAWEALIEESPQMRAADTELEKAQAPHKLRYAQDILSAFERVPTAWDFATKAEEFVVQAVSIAERTSADPAAIAALRDSVSTRLETHSDTVNARYLASNEAGVDSSRSIAELFQAARQAYGDAAWAYQDIGHHYYEGLAAKDDIASSETATDALAAVTKAVEHLLLVFDAYDEWADAHGEAQQIAKLAESTPLPQDVVDAADTAGADLSAAKASFEASVEAVVLDADAHSAFRRSFQESCR